MKKKQEKTNCYWQVGKRKTWGESKKADKNRNLLEEALMRTVEE